MMWKSLLQYTHIHNKANIKNNDFYVCLTLRLEFLYADRTLAPLKAEYRHSLKFVVKENTIVLFLCEDLNVSSIVTGLNFIFLLSCLPTYIIYYT